VGVRPDLAGEGGFARRLGRGQGQHCLTFNGVATIGAKRLYGAHKREQWVIDGYGGSYLRVLQIRAIDTLNPAIERIPMSQSTVLIRTQMFAAATAMSAAGLLIVSPPAQARPMLPVPLAPACSQWGFPGNFSLKQSTGDTVRFNSTGPVASGPAHATGGINGAFDGIVTGGITGDKVNFVIDWGIIYGNQTSPSRGRYTGLVGTDGFAHGDSFDESGGASAQWDSLVPLACTTPAPPPPAPAPPPAPVSHQPVPPAAAQTAAARLGVAVNGPTTLTAGMSGTYNVSVSNSGDVSAPVELFISFNGKLQQTGQPGSSGGFDCTVNNYSGGTSSVHCTVGQFGSKATANITVQGQGSAPGAGQLVVNINSSDPGAQFVQKSQQLNVTIT